MTTNSEKNIEKIETLPTVFSSFSSSSFVENETKKNCTNNIDLSSNSSSTFVSDYGTPPFINRINFPNSYWIQCVICEESKLKNGYFIGHTCKICSSCYTNIQTHKLPYSQFIKLFNKLPLVSFTSPNGAIPTQPPCAAICGSYQLY